MFNDIGSFNTVFWLLASVLIVLVVFEKQCLSLEAKFDDWRKNNVKKNKRTH